MRKYWFRKRASDAIGFEHLKIELGIAFVSSIIYFTYLNIVTLPCEQHRYTYKSSSSITSESLYMKLSILSLSLSSLSI